MIERARTSYSNFHYKMCAQVLNNFFFLVVTAIAACCAKQSFRKKKKKENRAEQSRNGEYNEHYSLQLKTHKRQWLLIRVQVVKNY